MKKYRILLVDDESTILAAVKEILELSDYHVTTATDGKIAYNILHRASFDLMITNIKMPRMSGFELLRLSKSKFPHLPVIILSGMITEEYFEDLFKDGADDCHIKGGSLDLDRFLKSIETVIKKYQKIKNTTNK